MNFKGQTNERAPNKLPTIYKETLTFPTSDDLTKEIQLQVEENKEFLAEFPKSEKQAPNPPKKESTNNSFKIS